MNGGLETIYIIISGAGTAQRMPALIGRLAREFERTIVVPTENAVRVISRREPDLIGAIDVVDSYFHSAILPQPPRGVVLVAPCTFNSLNKLAGGIADTLALSVAAEAIGRGTPVIVAVSVNPPLLRHPRARQSMETLRSWGVTVIDPDTSDGWATMAPDNVLLAAVHDARDASRG